MRVQFRVLAVSILFVFAGSAFAAQAKKDLTPQQQRMSTCNTQATGKKGDERKAFMSSCLKGEQPAAAPKMTQQDKMKKCNADASAKTLKGDERKTFMSTCLKG
ncbi:hypothetical protein KPL74_11285 [Bacillus sp. NP157]|nr:hypothetical protein KPL74_11285 [Bacillus sp. NP157]